MNVQSRWPAFSNRVSLLLSCAAGAALLGILTGSLSATTPMAMGTEPAATSQPAASQPVKTKEQKKEEETARVMEFFRVTQPDVYDQVRALREGDPAKFEKMIHDAAAMVNRLESLKKRNPALYTMRMKDFELCYKTLRLSKDIKRTDISPEDRQSMTHDLRDLVSTQFDLRQKIRQAEIDELQAQLADLGKQLQDRASDKDNLIKKRVDDLIETVPRLEW